MLRSHLHKTPALQGFERDQDTAGAVSVIFIILTLRSTRFHRHWGNHIPKQLTRTFIKAYDRTHRIIRFFVQRYDIFHMPKIVPSDFPDAPAFD